MTSLLSLIALWLSANFGLPATADFPQVLHVPQATIAALRYRGLLADRQAPPEPRAPDTSQSLGTDVVAVYDYRNRRIYLQEGWTGATPAELSVLVHEMVHHLQYAAGTTFECPQAQEKAAFEAQERWLNLFGRSLQGEFDLDPLTLLVRTTCHY